jgi:hypothetical protein
MMLSIPGRKKVCFPPFIRQQVTAAGKAIAKMTHLLCLPSSACFHLDLAAITKARLTF